MHHIQEGRIVFVDENDHLLAGLLINFADEIEQSYIWVGRIRHDSPFLFMLFQNKEKIAYQRILLHVLATRQIKMQDRVFHPILFQPFHLQSLEKFLLSFEVALQGRDKKRLSESTRASQKKIFLARMGHLMDVTGLVNIEIILGDNLRECLNAYRIEFCCHNLHRFDFGTKLSKISENNKQIGVKNTRLG